MVELRTAKLLKDKVQLAYHMEYYQQVLQQNSSMRLKEAVLLILENVEYTHLETDRI